MFTAVPLVGDLLVNWIWGGFSVDNPALNRFYSFHFILPFIIFAVVFMHLWALHVHKSGNPLGIDVKGPQDTLPFHPYYTAKDAYGMGIFLIIYFYFVFFAPNAFGEVDNYIPANPLLTPPHIVPEWYFLPYYAILRAVPEIWFISAKLGGVIAMLASVCILFILPWLDTSKVRSARFRPVYKYFFWFFVLDCFILGWVGANSPDDVWHGIPFLWIGRATTVYYFAHFIVILPLLGWFEPTRPLPESISKAVTGEEAAEKEASS
jgi:quinol-cytochrome oxidoreductase complex cytochrome b subunit